MGISTRIITPNVDVWTYDGMLNDGIHHMRKTSMHWE